MEDQRLSYLLYRLADGKINVEELLELEQYSLDEGKFQHHLANMMEGGEDEHVAAKKNWEPLLEHVLATDKVPAVKRVHTLRRYSVAASLLVLVSAGLYWLLARDSVKSSTPAIHAEKEVIESGKEGAVLTLSDGRRIVLDSLSDGVVAMQNGTSVKIKDGMLAYDIASSSSGEVIYNTMQTPRGRQFRLMLPDGSKVWLNAGSTLRYPAVFAGSERKVEVQGEAWFEVVALRDQPFLLTVNGKNTVQVLGTEFNVNAYEEENIYTTLFSGAIRTITASGASAVMKPGQQAVTDQQDALKVISIDRSALERVAAWKNGYFNFEGISLDEAMRQLERWYDIRVIYENGIPDIQFWGKMERSLPLETLLQMLKGSRLNFRMETGRKLVVVNKPSS